MSITITSTTTTTLTGKSEITVMNEIVDESINAVIQEAVTHFNKDKKRICSPEEDCRFFWNDRELNAFLKQIKYPEKVWVSTIYDHGQFYAYRVGRVLKNKKKGLVKY